MDLALHKLASQSLAETPLVVSVEGMGLVMIGGTDENILAQTEKGWSWLDDWFYANWPWVIVAIVILLIWFAPAISEIIEMIKERRRK